MRDNSVWVAAITLGAIAAALTMTGSILGFGDLPLWARCLANGVSVAFAVWLWGGIALDFARAVQRRRRQGPSR